MHGTMITELTLIMRKYLIGGNYPTRKTLETWHTALLKYSDNNSKPLLNQYATLADKKMTSLCSFKLIITCHITPVYL